MMMMMMMTMMMMMMMMMIIIENADAKPPHPNWFSCVWFAQNVCYDHAGSAPRAPEIARDRQRSSKSGPSIDFAKNFLPIYSPEGQNPPSEASKSTSDRPGDAQEQPRGPDASKFQKFFTDLGKFPKFLKPQTALREAKSSQDDPKSSPRAPQESPGAVQEGPRVAFGDVLSYFLRLGSAFEAIC